MQILSSSVIYDLDFNPDLGLVAAGDFTDAGGVADADYIALRDDTSEVWSAIGSAAVGRIFNVEINQGSIYATGRFSIRSEIFGVAKYDGSTWAGLGNDNDFSSGDSIQSLEVFSNGDVVVVGYFSDEAGNTDVDNLAFWDGTQWGALGANPGFQANALYVDDNDQLFY